MIPAGYHNLGDTVRFRAGTPWLPRLGEWLCRRFLGAAGAVDSPFWVNR